MPPKQQVVNTLFLLLGKTPKVVRPPSQSERLVGVSQERFYLESSNFTRASVPTHSTATPDMTSRATFPRKL